MKIKSGSGVIVWIRDIFKIFPTKNSSSNTRICHQFFLNILLRGILLKLMISNVYFKNIMEVCMDY